MENRIPAAKKVTKPPIGGYSILTLATVFWVKNDRIKNICYRIENRQEMFDKTCVILNQKMTDFSKIDHFQGFILQKPPSN
jgi:hypothetical protein